MKSIDSIQSQAESFRNTELPAGSAATQDPVAAQDSARLSNTSLDLKAIDSFLDLNRSDRIPFGSLSPEERQAFVTTLNKLIQQGIVGIEELKINGQRQKYFVVNTLGDKRTYGAKPVRRDDEPRRYPVPPELVDSFPQTNPTDGSSTSDTASPANKSSDPIQ